MALSANARPIEGAVATQGVSDRMTFLRKTYAHLGVALIAFAALTAGMLQYATQTSLKFSSWAFTGRWNWMMVLILFMVVGWVAQKLAMSQSSRGLQYAGLGLAVVAESVLLQPMLWILIAKFGGPEGRAAMMNGDLAMGTEAGRILAEAVGITIAIFLGLTATVFWTKKDFTFMRGALSIGCFAAIGVIICSILFGFHLGAVFSGLMILLMAGYILFQTSLVMSYFPPSGYVAASLMLFSTIATLFWYVLRFVMEMNRSR
jgi:hypothetical protein